MTDLARDRTRDDIVYRDAVCREDGLASRRMPGSRIGWWDIATLGVLLALTALVLATFRSYAVSNDEWVQHHYGQLILSYYRSGFTDRSLFSFDNLYLYGGLFDMAAVLLHRVVPLELYDLRHLMTALIGVGGIGAAAALARHIAGSRAGCLAALCLASCGTWYGDMFTHTKDVPLAAAMTGASYFLIRAARDLPRPRWRDVFGFGFLTGCALGIKVLGLLLPVYAGLITVLALSARAPDMRARFARQAVARFAPALLLSYLIMIAAWPWAALAPLNPLRGLFQFADFHYHIKTILDGHIYEMAAVPRLYVPIYIAIRTPLLLLGAALLALILVLASDRMGSWFSGQRRRETAFVIVMAIFPVACQVIGHGPAFTGMRHFLFVLPLIAVLAAIGLEWALSSLTRQHWVIAACALAAILADISWNADTLYELHPYEYLYYNPLVGGLAGASHRYVMDYWVAIMPAAVAELGGYLNRSEGKNVVPAVYNVDVCGDRNSFERELSVQHLIGRLRWTDDWNRADFFIAPTHGDCNNLLTGNVIAKIQRMGVLIGVIKDRRNITRPAMVQIHRKS
ncbi:MAG: glycosyltransferase family 39 protein [Xanthobacteraceae bacterium]|nr:glycosyltransferase family 39 protein [Xanthobacteraceae bacterium]